MNQFRSKLHLDENQQLEVLQWATEDLSIVEISRRLGIHPWAFGQYRKENPMFAEKFQEARTFSADLVAEEMKPIAQNQQVHPGITRNMLDTAKFIAGKRNPRVYGDKLDLNVNQTLDISGILDAAQARVAALAPADEPLEITGQCVEVDPLADIL